MKNRFECPICRGDCKALFFDGRDYFVNDGNSPDFGIVYCKICGIGYSQPEISDIELSKYYPADFESFVPRKSLNDFLQVLKYKSDLYQIKRKLENKNMPSMFEIGAGRGEFLYEAKKMGFRVSGIEPGMAGVEYAEKKYGIILKNIYASEIIYPDLSAEAIAQAGKYDVIVMRHTLEHINEFQKCLRSIFEDGLKPGGILFLKIPRMDSWEASFFGKFWHGFDLPRHRVHFTKRGICCLLKQIGFDCIEAKVEIVPTDMIRSIKYNSRHSANKVKKTLAMILVSFPYCILFSFAQLIAMIFSPFVSGRMVIIARKSKIN